MDVSQIPIRKDGSKAPSLKSWSEFQKRLPTKKELEEWAASGHGLAVVCGKVSGSLVCLDFDDRDAFFTWEGVVKPELSSFPVVATPSGGFHVYFRVESEELGKTQKLAQGDGAKTLIETRGEGAYAVRPERSFGPSGFVHEAKVPYRYDNDLQIEAAPVLSEAEVEEWFDAARSINEYEIQPYGGKAREASNDPKMPGNDFNRKHSIEDVAVEYGWEPIATDRSGKLTLRRPGKETRGISGTIGGPGYGENRLYVFSSDAAPLEPQRSYSPFQLFAMYEHNGDFKNASRVLRERGYGQDSDVPEWLLSEWEVAMERAQRLLDDTGDPAPFGFADWVRDSEAYKRAVLGEPGDRREHKDPRRHLDWQLLLHCFAFQPDDKTFALGSIWKAYESCENATTEQRKRARQPWYFASMHSYLLKFGTSMAEVEDEASGEDGEEQLLRSLSKLLGINLTGIWYEERSPNSLWYFSILQDDEEVVVPLGVGKSILSFGTMALAIAPFSGAMPEYFSQKSWHSVARVIVRLAEYRPVAEVSDKDSVRFCLKGYFEARGKLAVKGGDEFEDSLLKNLPVDMGGAEVAFSAQSVWQWISQSRMSVSTKDFRSFRSVLSDLGCEEYRPKIERDGRNKRPRFLKLGLDQLDE